MAYADPSETLEEIFTRRDQLRAKAAELRERASKVSELTRDDFLRLAAQYDGLADQLGRSADIVMRSKSDSRAK